MFLPSFSEALRHLKGRHRGRHRRRYRPKFPLATSPAGRRHRVLRRDVNNFGVDAAVQHSGYKVGAQPLNLVRAGVPLRQ